MYRRVCGHDTYILVKSLTYSLDYPWHDLPYPIVDVGGGIGALEMAIMKSEKNRHLEFIIFDIPKTVENAAKVCI